MGQEREIHMTDATKQQIEITLAPWRERVVTHPLYAHLHDEEAIRLFMQAHVFAVWDFQSLLKALQRLLTCVEVPWLPTSDPQARRLLNEIVLDEESDQAPGGGHLSHFEIYLQAMRECGANVTPIQTFLGYLRAGLTVEEALETSAVPPGVGPFVRATMAMARSTAPHRVAAAFAYGREEVTPAMFCGLVDRLAGLSPQSWGTLRYYLDRHIGTKTAGQLEDTLDRILPGVVDRDVSAEFLRLREAAVVEIDHNDPTRRVQLRGHDSRKTDRARADDGHGVAWSHAAALDAHLEGGRKDV